MCKLNSKLVGKDIERELSFALSNNNDLYSYRTQVLNDFNERLGQECCYKCKDFYEGVICGHELVISKTSMEDIKETRKEVCSLDKKTKDLLVCLESCDYGFICKYNDVSYFIERDETAVVVYIGTKEEIESKYNIEIDESEILGRITIN